ncbi:hypothetical protein DFH08DRAFT_809037 [Mycena albidolilacea]|uniref:Uncharacterized protein n=1 Tax=Mycena albidolilacea TaxID=1033008 RepID=A0AAD7A0T8_9AGAR|nr:hypothetical protein DFH08DRAFT_809037 [Mycena albidolilacea]
MSSLAWCTVFLGTNFVQYNTESGVRFPSILVPPRTPAPGSGSCGGAGAGIHQALLTLVHHPFIATLYHLRLSACPSHAMLPPQLSPSAIPVPSRPELSSRRVHHLFLIVPLTLVLIPVCPSRSPCHWKLRPQSKERGGRREDGAGTDEGDSSTHPSCSSHVGRQEGVFQTVQCKHYWVVKWEEKWAAMWARAAAVLTDKLMDVTEGVVVEVEVDDEVAYGGNTMTRKAMQMRIYLINGLMERIAKFGCWHAMAQKELFFESYITKQGALETANSLDEPSQKGPKCKQITTEK